MKQGIEKLKRKFNEDPLTVIAIGALAATAVAKLIDATSAAQGRHAYAKQINHKVNNK